MRFTNPKHIPSKAGPAAALRHSDPEKYIQKLERYVRELERRLAANEEDSSNLRNAYLQLQDHVAQLERENNSSQEQAEIAHQQALMLKEASEEVVREYRDLREEYKQFVADAGKKFEAYGKVKNLLLRFLGTDADRVFRAEADEYTNELARVVEKLP